MSSEKPHCSPEDIALKSFFLGPQAENASWVQSLVEHVFRRWFDWRQSLYTSDGKAITSVDQQSALFQEHIKLFQNEVDELLERFQQEVPSFSPRYVGHMVSEVSLPALVGHILTLLYNPNNISSEVSRVGLRIERDAIGALISMLGCKHPDTCGHFTSGGTLANIEGGLRARARVARWLAVGAAARSRSLWEGTIFESAHMGWETHDRLRAALGDNQDWIGTFNTITGNPFDAAARLSSVFGTTYRGPVVLAPGNKHYSWNKMTEVLGLGSDSFREVETDEQGKVDPTCLQEALEQARREERPVLMVISVAGTTELGEVDPIDQVQDIIDTWHQAHHSDIWHHIDGAYGGFFCTLMHDQDDDILRAPVRKALRAVRRAHSVTIDPHKLGFVPYASGAFLCRSYREYDYTRIHAPYIDFHEGEDPGLSTLEGSRSAAGATSTWLTSRVIGFDRKGYGRILARSVLSARHLAHGLMAAHPMIRVNEAGDTNIVTFCLAHEGELVSATNARTMAFYQRFAPGENREFFVSRTTLGMQNYRRLLHAYTSEWGAVWDTDELVLVRMVLSNPFLETKETSVRYIPEFIDLLVAGLQKSPSKT